MAFEKGSSFYQVSKGFSMAQRTGGCDFDEEGPAGFRERERWPGASKEKKCPLFRSPEGLVTANGFGYCDIDSTSAACQGDVKFCEKSDVMK